MPPGFGHGFCYGRHGFGQQPELQLRVCLDVIAKALNGEVQPRTFLAAVWRRRRSGSWKVASDLLSPLSAQRSCSTFGPGETQARRGVWCNGQTNRSEK